MSCRNWDRSPWGFSSFQRSRTRSTLAFRDARSRRCAVVLHRPAREPAGRDPRRGGQHGREGARAARWPSPLSAVFRRPAHRRRPRSAQVLSLDNMGLYSGKAAQVRAPSARSCAASRTRNRKHSSDCFVPSVPAEGTRARAHPHRGPARAHQPCRGELPPALAGCVVRAALSPTRVSRRRP